MKVLQYCCIGISNSMHIYIYIYIKSFSINILLTFDYFGWSLKLCLYVLKYLTTSMQQYFINIIYNVIIQLFAKCASLSDI